MAENISLVAQLIIDRTKALVAIQELHSKNVPAAIACGECHDRFPCPTRKLADVALGEVQ